MTLIIQYPKSYVDHSSFLFKFKNKEGVVESMALSKNNISARKLEGYLKWCKVIQWGRRNPVKFAEEFLGTYLGIVLMLLIVYMLQN